MASRTITFSVALALARAAVMLPKIFSDNMVLQTRLSYGQRPLIFGYADANEVVTVNITAGKSTTTLSGVANSTTGYWSITLPANNEVTNVSLSIAGSNDPTNVTVINNAAYGDVLLCGGQSNMVMSVIATFNGSQYSNITWPNIRLFNVIEAGSTTPQRDLPDTSAYPASSCIWYDNPVSGHPDIHKCEQWQIAQPGVTEYMSAICFYTAMYMYQTGAIPPDRVIGLVHSALPGTAMELWAEQPVIDKCAPYLQAESSEQGSRDDTTAYVHDPALQPDNIAAYVPERVRANIPPGNSTLYNAMIAPIAGYAIRAALWDQGESNMGQPFLYFSCLFQGLIESWRRAWRIGDFAWLFVGLGPQEYNSNQWPSYIPTPHDAQMSALPGHGTTDTSGIAVAYDLGDRSSPYAPAHVHTRNKTEIGRRLALMIQHVQWGVQYPAGGVPVANGTLPLDWSGPWPTSFVDNGDGSYTLSFDTLTGKGIVMQDAKDCWECCDGSKALDLFQVLQPGSSTTWVNMSWSVIAGSSVTNSLKLTPVKAASYTTLRYAPSLWPQCAVYSASNLVPVNTFSALNLSTTIGTSSVTNSVVAPVQGRTNVKPGSTIVAATPPMGFNSWNAYHCNIDANIIMQTADFLANSGMAALGYSFINIDDCWQVDRLPNGTIIPDPVRFPYGMKALADYVHSKGLKFGLYTAQGSQTCQQRPGAYNHELIDAQTYCDFGLDYLKIDQCGGTEHPVLNTSWALFHQGFQQCVQNGGRPIVQSIEYCKDPSPTGCGPWIGQIANVWRTTSDIQASFASVLANLDGNNAMAQWTKPGNWADPDMLQVSNPGLSLEESKTHFTAWCIVSAPLLIGADLISGIDSSYMDILTAPEVIAVNQDALGVQGVRVSPANASGTECWAKKLADGSYAAMLINRGDVPSTAACTWAQVGLPQPNGAAAVRDLWARQDLGSFTGQYTATLPVHGAALIKVHQ